MIDPARPDTWPPRLLRSEVLALARYSKSKLRAEIKAKRMPGPIDRGTEDIFDRDAVLRALGLMQDDRSKETESRWGVDEGAIREARARRVRRVSRQECRK